MKKLLLVVTAVFSLAIINESVYGKSDKSKGENRGRNEKSERDNNRGGNGKSERGESRNSESKEYGTEKNQKALDAQRNWGHLKKELKNEDGSYNEEKLKEFFGVDELSKKIDGFDDKEIKEAIKVERIVRRELRMYEDSLPDLPDEAKGEEFFEDWVDYYIGNPDVAGCELEGEVDKESLAKMYSAVEKYCAFLEGLGEGKEYTEFDNNDESSEGEGTEVSVLPENIE